jgi:hypothetical protein
MVSITLLSLENEASEIRKIFQIISGFLWLVSGGGVKSGGGGP